MPLSFFTRPITHPQAHRRPGEPAEGDQEAAGPEKGPPGKDRPDHGGPGGLHGMLRFMGMQRVGHD